MLTELASYAYGHGLALEPGLAPKSARWAIWLNDKGDFIDLLDLRTLEGDRTFPRCPDLRQNELIAGGVIRSHFLLDTAEVVALLGVGRLDEARQDKALAKHEYFVALLEQAAADYPALATCARFLRSEENLRLLQGRLSAAKARPTEKMTFRVGTDFPVSSSAWHAWWRRFRAELGGDETGAALRPMRCLQTGELVRPLRTHPKIKGLAPVGGQPSGCVLIGFDKEAFTSYGLEQSDNAAVSEEAATVYVNAMNDLVKKADRPIAGTLLIYWFKEAVAAEDDPLSWIRGVFGARAEGEELEALQHAKRLVEGIAKGQRADLAGNIFHAAIVSAAGGRVMVRDWLEGSFSQLARNAVLWFEDLTICTRDGRGLARDPGLPALMFSLVRQDLAELPPSLAPEMWRAALFGRPIPHLAVSAALQRIRAETVDSSKVPNHARMGLMKAHHIRKTRFQGGEDALRPYLNEEHPSAAYQSGRLMAVLAAIQRKALGDVGASIVQRYYAAASTTPAMVLGRLVRQSHFHLNKLDKGLVTWYERIIGAIMRQLGDGLPVTLDPEGQSLFALGYYQQMAALYGGKHQDEMKEEEANE